MKQTMEEVFVPYSSGNGDDVVLHKHLRIAILFQILSNGYLLVFAVG